MLQKHSRELQSSNDALHQASMSSERQQKSHDERMKLAKRLQEA